MTVNPELQIEQRKPEWGDENVEALLNGAGAGGFELLLGLELFGQKKQVVLDKLISTIEAASDAKLVTDLRLKVKELLISATDLKTIEFSQPHIQASLQRMSPSKKAEFLKFFGEALRKGKTSMLVKLCTEIWPLLEGERAKVISTGFGSKYVILDGAGRFQVSYDDKMRAWECDCHDLTPPCTHVMAVQIYRKAS